MTDELEKRVVQALKDGRLLLEHWSAQVSACDDCNKMKAETDPYLNGLKSLLKEIGGGSL